MLFYRIFPAIAAGCAALMDIQRAKVDNGWLLFCVLVSLFTRIWKMDVSSLGSWICGLLVPILILGILFKILNCISYSFLIGAVISAALMISSGIVCQRILYLLHYISVYFKTGKREPYYKSGMPLENFHFTVPIFLSALLYAGGVY